MKVCPNCRSSFDSKLAICPFCGTIVQGGHPSYPNFNSGKEPVSVGGWIGRSLIPYIPLVGGIVYLIMLFIWSGDTQKEETFRNWAKAQLIVMAAVVGLAIVLALIFGGSLSEMLRYM